MKTLIPILIIISFIISSCSNPFGGGGSEIGDDYGPAPVVPSTPQTSIAPSVVSGSIQEATTSLSRKASVAVGTSTSDVKLNTSLNRTVFISVQGQIISN